MRLMSVIVVVLCFCFLEERNSWGLMCMLIVLGILCCFLIRFVCIFFVLVFDLVFYDIIMFFLSFLWSLFFSFEVFCLLDLYLLMFVWFLYYLIREMLVKVGRLSGFLMCFVLWQIYDGLLKIRLGIMVGFCMLIFYSDQKNGDCYEVLYFFYFGDYGYIFVQGLYIIYEDLYFVIMGGLGIFVGCYGQVKLYQIIFFFKFFYMFYL